MKRPNFEVVNIYTLKVAASKEMPRYVKIGDIEYKLIQDYKMVTGESGLGGTKNGSFTVNTIGYLYFCIGDNASIGLHLSTIAPMDGGPQGFKAKTYLGAVGLDATGFDFSFADGRFEFGQSSTSYEYTISATSPTATTIKVPKTAKSFYSRGLFISSAAGLTLVLGSKSDNGLSRLRCTSNTASQTAVGFFEVPIFTPQITYLSVTGETSARIRILGWTESPEDYP